MWTTIALWGAKLLTGGRSLLAVGGIIGVMLSYMKGRGDAWHAAELQAYKQWQQRVEAVEKLNKEYQVEILEMISDNEALREEVDKLNDEASKDPGASNKSLGVNSVRRLNKIK